MTFGLSFFKANGSKENGILRMSKNEDLSYSSALSLGFKGLKYSYISCPPTIPVASSIFFGGGTAHAT